MASGGFEVTFSELDAAAAEYQKQAEFLRQAVARFVSSAELTPGDFGRLPESKQLDQQYEGFYKQVSRDMAKLYGGLTDGANKLDAASAKYQAAEEANTNAARAV
jgi:uncharacterized protein YukE